MTEETPGTVVITTREIYDELVGTRADIQRVLGVLPDHKETLGDHETRIRSLEKAKYWIAGIAAVMGAGATEALSQITSL